MNDNELWKKLTDVFRATLGVKDAVLKPETTAADVPQWNSLNHVQLILAVESAFNIRFTHGEIASFANVGDMVRAIERHLQQ